MASPSGGWMSQLGPIVDPVRECRRDRQQPVLRAERRIVPQLEA